MTVVDPARETETGQREVVSILVLVDDGRRRRPTGFVGGFSAMFQSLFLWMTVVDRSSVRAPLGN